MWWTPTSGLLRAAASVLAALEPTPRQPVMPMLYVFSKDSSETHSPVTTETLTWSAREGNSIDI
jgi:hypothetical protein